MKGHTIIAHEAERPKGENVVDLMEALRKSVAGSSGKGKPARGGKKRA